MIRVLIVDDEVLIRKLLQHIVDWNALGFEIIGEAADGLQALDMVESLKPNLVMLDINLPLFDGISVLKRLNAEHREIASIMVTGYESFAYIQDAMRAGATDYVVKPIQETEVIAALNRAKQQIVKQQTLAKYTFLAKSSPDLSRKKHVNTALCIALCFEIDQYEKALRNVEERAVWVHIVREICLSLLSNYGDVEMDSEGKQMMALLYTDLLPCDLRPFESIIDDVYRNTGLSISIGISDLASSSDTADIRRKAELALSQKFLGGCGKLYR
ncbi:MAG: response regulator, partial [Clostridia bacterium]